MDKIVELMGEDAFRQAIQEYLRTYAYGNATWDDLVAILDKHTDVDIKSFSHFWVYKPFMNNIFIYKHKGRWHISNPDGKGHLQAFNCLYIYEDGGREEVTIPAGTTNYEVPRGVEMVLPNSDGRGYGHFVLDAKIIAWLTTNMRSIEDDLMRQSFITVLNEEYEANWLLDNSLDSRHWLDFLLGYLPYEKNHLVASTINGYLTRPLLRAGNAEDEARLWEIATTHDNIALRRGLKMTLAHTMRSEEVCNIMYEIWLSASDTTLNESDYMTLAYELAVRYPERYEEIYATQLSRITNPDRRNQFEYIMRGMNPDIEARNALFESLMEPENRRIEPWTATLLSYLNHHLRQEEAIGYIYRALQEIEEVQRTGDIFFPRNWAGALLAGHTSPEAKAEVERFLADNPNLNPLLRNKILQAAR
jgi:aminopeptidase N